MLLATDLAVARPPRGHGHADRQRGQLGRHRRAGRRGLRRRRRAGSTAMTAELGRAGARRPSRVVPPGRAASSPRRRTPRRLPRRRRGRQGADPGGRGVPGRAVASGSRCRLHGRPARRLPGAAGDQPQPVHVPAPARSRRRPFDIVGSSPEALVTVRRRAATTHPIAGTRLARRHRGGGRAAGRRTCSPTRRSAPSTSCSSTSGRNDLGRVCAPGTVEGASTSSRSSATATSCTSSRPSPGSCAPSRTAFDALTACFPAGTLSGAPEAARHGDHRGAGAHPARPLRRHRRLPRLRRRRRHRDRHPHRAGPRRRRLRAGRRRDRGRLRPGGRGRRVPEQGARRAVARSATAATLRTPGPDDVAGTGGGVRRRRRDRRLAPPAATWRPDGARSTGPWRRRRLVRRLRRAGRRRRGAGGAARPAGSRSSVDAVGRGRHRRRRRAPHLVPGLSGVALLALRRRRRGRRAGRRRRAGVLGVVVAAAGASSASPSSGCCWPRPPPRPRRPAGRPRGRRPRSPGAGRAAAGPAAGRARRPCCCSRPGRRLSRRAPPAPARCPATPPGPPTAGAPTLDPDRRRLGGARRRPRPDRPTHRRRHRATAHRRRDPADGSAPGRGPVEHVRGRSEPHDDPPTCRGDGPPDRGPQRERRTTADEPERRSVLDSIVDGVRADLAAREAAGRLRRDQAPVGRRRRRRAT